MARSAPMGEHATAKAYLRRRATTETPTRPAASMNNAEGSGTEIVAITVGAEVAPKEAGAAMPAMTAAANSDFFTRFVQASSFKDSSKRPEN